jgi:hypothetical protein
MNAARPAVQRRARVVPANVVAPEHHDVRPVVHRHPLLAVLRANRRPLPDVRLSDVLLRIPWRANEEGDMDEPREAATDVDVLVVGSGAAGLSAALAACEAGASRVLVAESEGVVGGSSRLSGGLIMGAGTRYQRALGIDTP